MKFTLQKSHLIDTHTHYWLQLLLTKSFEAFKKFLFEKNFVFTSLLEIIFFSNQSHKIQNAIRAQPNSRHKRLIKKKRSKLYYQFNEK